MPYIKPEDKPEFDGHITALADAISRVAAKYGYPGAFMGLLNYCCTALALRVIPERRYWTIAAISGVFHNVADEFYRRYAAPYEDEQIAKNGDVY